MVAWNRVIHNTQQSAKTRGRECRLAPEDIIKLAQGSCLYCGVLPVKTMGGCDRNRRCSEDWIALVTRKANGIDRVFNQFDYEAGNAVSCCPMCNRAKHKLTLFEWLSWLSETPLGVRLGFIKSELTRICGPDWEQRMMDEWKQHQEKEHAG